EGNLHAVGHPGIQVIPLAWALAEHEGRPGRDLLAAFIAGYEVSARIKRASATRLAVHPHGTFGTIGAAVALARLFGYSPAALRVHQDPRLRALHPWRARLRRDPDGEAPARARVHRRHPRAHVRDGREPRPHGRPLGVRRAILAALRRGVAPLSRRLGARQL